MRLFDPNGPAEVQSCLSFAAGMSMRQRRILRTALRMFAEREYAAVSLRDIAAEAGVSLTLIDHHFGAKHALFAAVVRSWSGTLEQAGADIRHAVAQGRVAHAGDLFDLCMQPLDRLRADPDGLPVLRLWARHRLTQDPALAAPLEVALRPYRSAVALGLERLYPASASLDREWTAAAALAALVEWSVTVPACRDTLEEPACPACTRVQLRRQLTGGWTACLSDSADCAC